VSPNNESVAAQLRKQQPLNHARLFHHAEQVISMIKIHEMAAAVFSVINAAELRPAFVTAAALHFAATAAMCCHHSCLCTHL
jgi:hypothetical protein